MAGEKTMMNLSYDTTSMVTTNWRSLSDFLTRCCFRQHSGATWWQRVGGECNNGNGNVAAVEYGNDGGADGGNNNKGEVGDPGGSAAACCWGWRSLWTSGWCDGCLTWASFPDWWAPTSDIVGKFSCSLTRVGKARVGQGGSVCVSCWALEQSRSFDILRTIESCALCLPHLASLMYGIIALW